MAIQEQTPPEPPTEPEPVTIIRYPNRRLYDCSQGKYVNLQDVEDTIRRGRTVHVRDSKSGEDLTRWVLTQILLERYPERMNLLPVTLLHQMLRANDMLFGVIREALQRALLSVEFWQRFPSANLLGSPQDWLRSLLPGARASAEAPAAQAGEADVAVLLRRIDELERRLDERDASSGKRKARAKEG